MSTQSPSNPTTIFPSGCFALSDIASNNFIDHQTFASTAVRSFFNAFAMQFENDPFGNFYYLTLQSQFDGSWVVGTANGNNMDLALGGASINDAALFLMSNTQGYIAAASFATNFSLTVLDTQNGTFLPIQQQGNGVYAGVANGTAASLQGVGMGEGNWGPYNTNGSYQYLSFDYLDLSGWNSWFAGKDFTGSSFQQTNLQTVDFASSNLTNCNFTGAVYSGSSPYSGAQMSSINIGGATLTKLDVRLLGNAVNWIAGTGPQLTNFSGSVIDFNSFLVPQTNVYNISYCDFSQATLINVPAGALVGLIATGANLTGMQFPNVDLTGANFQNAILSNVNFNGANLSNANLSGATATATNFNNAIMDQTIMTGIFAGGQNGASGATFNFAQMSNVVLNNANLTGANFSGAVLYGGSTSINNTQSMQSVNFSNAYLANISLDNSDLMGCIFDGACLLNVDFSNSNLGPANAGEVGSSMVKACLQGANFSGTTLTGVDMSGAAISFVQGALPVKGCGSLLPPSENYSVTLGLNESTLQDTVTCPNSFTYVQNVQDGLSITQMLTASHPPAQWACSKIK